KSMHMTFYISRSSDACSKKLAMVRCPNVQNLVFSSKFRLEHSWHGRLLTSPKNETSWVPVCAHRWSYNNSRVLCRSMGYNDSTSTIISKQIPYNYGYIVVKTDIKCNGMEHHLKDCIHLTWENCSQIVLSCAMSQLNVHLESEGPYTGLPAFDFYNKGNLGTTTLCKSCRVCSTIWGIQEAKTICKILGYPPQYTSTRVLHFETSLTQDLIIQGFRCKYM
ncbi:unnamed protein product, partial [Owenia fusiformis]